jgi:PiT family inorganic phosphate transporter
MFLVLLGAASAIWLRSRRIPVDENNVNDDWDAVTVQPTAPERVAATTAN